MRGVRRQGRERRAAGGVAGGRAAKYYPPDKREELMKLLGSGSKVHVHVRFYDRSASGAAP